jgi:septal ring-binding cell division protein DamX
MHQMLKKTCLVLACCLSLKPLVAQPVSDAVELINKGQHEAAFKLLDYLANQGDAAAQYNLALIYKKGIGRAQDAAQASFWFKKAAQQGMAQAYNQLQVKAIEPAIGVHAKNLYTPEEWVKAQKPENYTLQLASSTNKKLIEKYYLENSLQGKAGYYLNRRDGENWYALVYGSYSSVAQANEAVANLPADLKKWSPWVRKLKVIQRIMNN